VTTWVTLSLTLANSWYCARFWPTSFSEHPGFHPYHL
jgi:hypothetical protein